MLIFLTSFIYKGYTLSLIHIYFTGRAPGRGAYLCKNAECLRRAIKGRKLERAFGAAIPDEVYTRLETELSGHE